MAAASDGPYDIEFFWDPVCPFAWITSRWVARVAARRDYRVDWRFISLRLVNKDKDDATEISTAAEEVHMVGLRTLRVAAAVRDELGRDVLGDLVTSYGESYWDQPKGTGVRHRLSTAEHVEGVLRRAGLPDRFAASMDDASWDQLLDAECELALARTGRDVGTPIITFNPPDGLSFFGPVISRVPPDDECVELWDAVIKLASFTGFAELKRSDRDPLELNYVGGVSAPPISELDGTDRRTGPAEPQR